MSSHWVSRPAAGRLETMSLTRDASGRSATIRPVKLPESGDPTLPTEVGDAADAAAAAAEGDSFGDGLARLRRGVSSSAGEDRDVGLRAPRSSPIRLTDATLRSTAFCRTACLGDCQFFRPGTMSRVRLNCATLETIFLCNCCRSQCLLHFFEL